MAVDRIFYSAESLTEQSTTSTTFVDLATLTFTPNANKSYVYIAVCQAKYGSTADGCELRLRNDTDGVNLANILRAQENTGNYLAYQMMGVETFGASPGAKNIKLQGLAEVSGVTLFVRDVKILALELGANDKFQQDSAVFIHNQTFFQTSITLTFTPPAVADYLFIFGADISHERATSHRVSVQGLLDNTTVKSAGTFTPQRAFDYISYLAATKINLSAVSHSFTIEASSSQTGKEGYTRNNTIVALYLPDFHSENSSFTAGDLVNSTTTFDVSETLTFTPVVQSYLVIESLMYQSMTTTGDFIGDAREGTTVNYSEIDQQTGNSSDKYSVFHSFIKTLTASSTTFDTRFKTGIAFRNQTVRDRGIIALQLTAPSNVLVTPGAGSVSITGQATGFNRGIAVGAGSTAITGKVPTSDIMTKLFPPAGTLSIAGKVPTQIDSIGVASFQLISIAWTPSIIDSVPVASSSIAIATSAPTIAFGQIVGVPNSSIALAGQNLTFDRKIAITNAAATITGRAPAISAGQTVVVGSTAISFTSQVPTQLDSVPVANASIAVTNQTPSITQGTVVVVGVATAIASTGQTPTLATAIAVASSAISIAGQTPTTSLGQSVAVGNAGLTTTGQIPTLPSGISVPVPVASIAITGQAPSTTQNIAIPVPVNSIASTGQSVAIILAVTVTIPAASLASTGKSPMLGDAVGVSLASIILTGKVPGIINTSAILVPSASLTMSETVPGTVVLPGAAPSRGTILINNAVPTILVGTSIAVPNTHLFIGSKAKLLVLHLDGTEGATDLADPGFVDDSFFGRVPSAAESNFVVGVSLSSFSGNTFGSTGLIFHTPLANGDSRRGFGYDNANTPILSLNQNWKISFRVLFPNNSRRFQYIGTNQGATNVASGWQIFSGLGSPGTVAYSFRYSTGTTTKLIYAEAPNVGNFTSRLVKFTYTASNRALRIYVNGAFMGEGQIESDAVLHGPTNKLFIGNYSFVEVFSPFSNLIEEFLIEQSANAIFGVGETTSLDMPPANPSAASAQGFIPTIFVGQFTTVPAQTLALTGQVSSSTGVGVRSLPGKVGITLTGSVPATFMAPPVGVPAAAIAITGQGVIAGVTNIGIASLSLTGQPVGFDRKVPVGSQSKSLAPRTPSVHQGLLIAVPSVTIASTGQAPFLKDDFATTASATTLTVHIPLVSSNVKEVVPTETVLFSVSVPSTAQGTVIVVGSSTLSFTGLAATESTTVRPGNAALTLSSKVSVILIGKAQPANAALSLAGKLPSIKLDITIAVPFVSVTFTVQGIGAGNFTAVGRDTVSFTSFDPLIDSGLIVPVGPTPAPINITGQPPVADSSKTVSPAETTISLSSLTAKTLGAVPTGIIGFSTFALETTALIESLETCDMNVIFPTVVDKLVVPDLQDVEFSFEKLRDVVLPDKFALDLKTFQGVTPVAPVKSIGQVKFLYQAFNETVQDVLDNKISTMISYLKPAEIETLEWNKTKDEVLDQAEQATSELFDSEAVKGFIRPSGEFSKRSSDQEYRTKKELSKLNKKFTGDQEQQAISNMDFAAGAGNVAESARRDSFIKRQTVDLEAANFLLQVNFEVFNLDVTKYNLELEAHQTAHATWLDELRSSLLELQQAELNIKARELNLKDEQLRLETFKGAIDYLVALKRVSAIELEGFEIQAQEEREKILKYRAEIDKFAALINLNISQFNLYQAGVKKETSKVELYQANVAVADAQLKLQNTKTRAGEITGRSKLEIANANLEKEKDKLRAARQKLEVSLNKLRTVGVDYNSTLSRYEASLRSWFSRHRILSADLQARNESIHKDNVTSERNATRQRVAFFRRTQDRNKTRSLANISTNAMRKSAEITGKTEVNSKLIHSIAGA